MTIVTPEEQYQGLRHGVGGRVVRRDVMSLHGPDAVSYLQGQCSQDVENMDVGDSRDALLLTPQGKLEALVRVVRSAEDGYRLDVDGGWGPIVQARLQRFKLRVKVDIEPLELQCLSLRGPRASERSQGLSAAQAVPFSWNGVTGVDLFGPTVDVPAGVPSCGPGAWEALRVEAGIPTMGRELDEHTIAAEADLLERAVSFTKGCYTGQELVARLDARGNKVARHLVGLVVDAGAGGPGASPVFHDAPAPVPADTVILESGDGAEVGRVTSSAVSPVLGTVALGYLHRRVVPPASVVLRLADGSQRPAEARPLPLVGEDSP